MPGAAAPARRERGLFWFYTALGVIAALAAATLASWKPLEARYHERAARAAYERGDSALAADEIKKLELMGPASRAAFRRLLEPNGPRFRIQVMQCVNRRENRWLLPEFVRLAVEDRDGPVGYLAIKSVESMSGELFYSDLFATGRPAETQAARAKLIEWWERDGRGKYDK